MCILRDRETKKAKRYTWTPYTEEKTLEDIERYNSHDDENYYEICEDEDMRTLLPLPLSQRQQDLNDIYDILKDIDTNLCNDEYDITYTRNTIDDMQGKLQEYIKTYGKEVKND